MHTLIIVGSFAGIGLMLLVGLFDVANQLKLRIEDEPRQQFPDAL